MAQFKPMIKMETTEPSVELKLKKGGHAKHHMKKGGKAEHGHKHMKHMMDGGVLGALAGQPALVKARRPALAAIARPAAPSMAARRAAMMAKKGGAAKHKAKGGKIQHLEEELKHHEHMKAGKAHHGLKKGGKACYAVGGTVSDSVARKYAETLMHTDEHMDTVKGPTGGVKEGNGGGYKKGGKVHHKATGGVMESNAGGYKKGGKVKHHAKGGSASGEEIDRFEARSAIEHDEGPYEETEMHTAKKDKAHGTGDVKEGNAGGYKHGGKAHHMKKGGASKKAYATGGSVNNAGRAVALVPRGVGAKKAPPVAITALSGTYKKGGKVASGNRKLESVYDSENAPDVRESKADTRLKYDQDTYQGQNIPKAPTYKKRGGKC